MVLSNNISKNSKLKKNLNSNNKSRLLHNRKYNIKSNLSGGATNQSYKLEINFIRF